MANKTIPLDRLGFEIEKIYNNLKIQSEQTKIKTLSKASQFNLKMKQRLTPEYKGNLKRSLRKEKTGANAWTITGEGHNPINGFPYIAWVDNRLGKNRNGRSYPDVQRTGIEGGGFWTKSDAVTQDKFTELVVEDVSKWETVK
jgi:hypothetical protein